MEWGKKTKIVCRCFPSISIWAIKKIRQQIKNFSQSVDELFERSCEEFQQN